MYFNTCQVCGAHLDPGEKCECNIENNQSGGTEMELLIKQEEGKISINFDEMKAALESKMSEYEGMLFTEDTKKAAKNEVANLRKLKKDIEDRRKSIKSSYMIPYEEFANQVKELTALIDKPIGLINSRIDIFEQARIDERKVKIRECYEEFIDGMEDILPLERIYDKQWENASMTLSKIKKAIDELVKKTQNDIQLIKSMKSDVEEEALSKYLSSLNLADGIAHINNYNETKAEVERKQAEQKAQEEAEKARLAEIEKQRVIDEAVETAVTEVVENIKQVDAVVSEVPSTDSIQEKTAFIQEDTKKVAYIVVGTDEELKTAEMALTSVGLIFERRDI